MAELFGIEDDDASGDFGGFGGTLDKTITYICDRWDGQLRRSRPAKSKTVAPSPRVDEVPAQVTHPAPEPKPQPRWPRGKRLFRVNTLGETNDRRLAFLQRRRQELGRCFGRLNDGERLGKTFPKKNAALLLEKNSTNQLGSLLGNTDSLLIVEGRFWSLIEAQVKRNIEAFNVALRDHRGRVVSTDYWIVNPIGTVDPSTAKDLPALFRPADDPSDYILGEALAREMHRAELTNVYLIEIGVDD